MSVLQAKHSEWRHGERTVTVTVRKGQARLCFRSEEVFHTRETEAKPKRTWRTEGLSTASKVRRCKDESMVIEASRWSVLQTEATPDSIITHWITLWKQLSEWERLGGRTLHWSISTVCRQHYQLNVWMGTYRLAVDPSFKSFIPGGQETPKNSRVLLQLYECQEQEETLSWLRKLSKSTKWVAIIHTR
jgi:hypothetical protein